MKLVGGVIVIGSLVWEDHLEKDEGDNIRQDWRRIYLSSEAPTYTRVPIRYGRESSTRKKTYTMIFSETCENNPGQGLILKFAEPITSFELLETQAIALAQAEGIYKPDNRRLTSQWGSVALLLNPTLVKKDPATYELIVNRWSDIYNTYRQTFNSTEYKIDSERNSVITATGMLNISWQKEMDPFDILIATPVIPKPKALLTPEEIADRQIKNEYVEYFDQNKKHSINTYQDEQIDQHRKLTRDKKGKS